MPPDRSNRWARYSSAKSYVTFRKTHVLEAASLPTIIIHMPSKWLIYKATKPSEMYTRVQNNMVLKVNRENPYVAELVKNGIDAVISY